MRNTPVMAALALMLAAGCGSTVPLTQTPPPQQELGVTATAPPTPGSAPGDPTGAVTAPGGVDGSGVAAPAAVSGGASTTVSGPAQSPGGGSPAPGSHTIRSSGGRTLLVGPGVSASTVAIGIPYATDVGAADQATGAAALDPGNTKGEEQAIWAYVNAHGGLGGRKAVLDFYGIPATTSDVNASFQAACTHFTQDNHDFVVLNKGTANFDTCLEQHGALHLVSDLTLSTAAGDAKLPHTVRPAGITLDDSARTLVQGLDTAGYFTGNVKVGIVAFDDAGFRSVINGIMLPALKALGHPVAPGDVQLVPPPNSVADYGTMDRAATNAAVHFRTDGVTNVILYDSDGALTQGFLSAAEAQKAHFNYGVNSQNGMQVGLAAGTVPPDQAVGSVGVGWLPDFDVVASQRPANALAKKCRAIMAAAGFPASGDNADVIQLFMCQDAFTLQAAMNSVTGDVTRDTVVAAMEALGRDVPNVADYALGLSHSQHDGIRELRLYGYDQRCQCYTYRPGTIHI